MAHITKDRVKEATTTTGTGPFALSGTTTGFRSFASVCAVGDTFRGTIQGIDGSGNPTGEWQSGTFVYSAANQISTVVVEDSSTGSAVSFSAGSKEVWIGQTATQAGWVREKLTANRTYYVRTDGNDANTGLANTAGGAFLTIQKAINVISTTLDLNGYDVTVQLADGTYTGGAVMRQVFGADSSGISRIFLTGNATTPANVVISTTSGHAVYNGSGGTWLAVSNLKVQTTTIGSGVSSSRNGIVSISNVVFGQCADFHMTSDVQGVIYALGNYSIAGGAQRHITAAFGGYMQIVSRTVTITGTPSFSTVFANAESCGSLYVPGNTFSGGATGKRYSVSANGTIFTNAGGATYFPGSTDGATATGGQYI